MRDKKELLADMQVMYEHLNQAYELAGGLRDSFTGVDDMELQGALKIYCNATRTNINQVSEFRGAFADKIKSIEQ